MAYDQDSLNTTLIYDIISGNDRSIFSINPSTGVIYLTSEIDLEEETLPGNTFVLQIEARQKDTPIKRAVARVEIEILDLNDNRPEVSQVIIQRKYSEFGQICVFFFTINKNWTRSSLFDLCVSNLFSFSLVRSGVLQYFDCRKSAQRI